MGDFSRDSFRATQNVLNEVRGTTVAPLINPRHYVSVRLQQGVPVLDAEWNEQDDIRRLELETLLVRAIGNGVPAGNDGFRISASGVPNDFYIETGLLFLDGWLTLNRSTVAYSTQPHRNHAGVSPALPIPLAPAPVARNELVYIDAWETLVHAQDDSRLVDPNIGIETCARVERIWVVRVAPIAAGDDPLDPATIPNRQPRHRYYPLALVARQPGPQISDAMITDLRRTHLTLGAVTHAPLLVDDAARGQRLNSTRLAGMFRAHLDVTRQWVTARPGTLFFPGNEVETWQVMNTYQDVRALAVAFEQQAHSEVLHRAAAEAAMQSYFDAEDGFMTLLEQHLGNGLGNADTQNFRDAHRLHMNGLAPNDPQSMAYALASNDVLGAVMAQERLNQELGLAGNDLPEGTVTVNLISVSPAGPLAADTAYRLTLRIQSNLLSAQGQEPIRAIAAAGPGWTLAFEGTTEADLRELVVTVPNQNSQDVVLLVTAVAGAANTNLNVSVRPERRQQLVNNHPPVAMAIGQEILPGAGALAALNYQGPALQPGNVASMPRAVIFGGITLPFGIDNLSVNPEQFQVRVTAQSAANGWQAPNEPAMPQLPVLGSQVANINFQTADQAGAVSPLTYRVELRRITGGANDPLPYARFDITFNLT